MHTFIAKLVVAEGKEAEFERLQTELSELTHSQEPGCLIYDVIRNKEQPRSYIVYARFKDEEAFNTHMNIDFHERLVPPVLECLAEEMDLQFYDWIA